MKRKKSIDWMLQSSGFQTVHRIAVEFFLKMSKNKFELDDGDGNGYD